MSAVKAFLTRFGRIHAALLAVFQGHFEPTW